MSHSSSARLASGDVTFAEDRPDAVRLALPSEADEIAAVQRRSWPQVLGPAAVRLLESVLLADMTEIWHSAIARPPHARCRVLVATAAGTGNGRLVGFATTLPSSDEDAEPTDGAIEEFVIEPSAQHQGHGSRLLHACVDTLRADGFTRARLWVNSGNDALRGFLSLAGWAADGAWREIGAEEGDGAEIRLRQVRLHTDITGEDLGG
jgi:GNAT superfamily N-acetyltransferase